GNDSIFNKLIVKLSNDGTTKKRGLFSKLVYKLTPTQSVDHDDGDSNSMAVEKQTEAARQTGTIWDIIRKADQASLEYMLSTDPSKVNERGFVGECPLHMMFIYGTDSHIEMAKYVIGKFPDATTQIYNQAEYYGENVLHIAIIKKNAAMVDWLLVDPSNKPYKETLLKATASGNFFKDGRPCYYGEYPLAFAACTNQWNLVEILINSGADMDMADSNGNNILHLLVIHNLPNLYTKYKARWIEENHRKKGILNDDFSPPTLVNEFDNEVPLWKRLNKEDLTPLTLAAKLGQKEMFSFLLEERKIVQWTFGPVSCVLYPLDQLDLGLPVEGKEVEIGGLELIVKHAHVDLIMHPRMIDLIDKKWDRFAGRIFFKRFMITLSYLFVFMLTIIFEQTRTETVEGEGEDAVITSVEYPKNYIYLLHRIGNGFVLAGALWKGRCEVNEMIGAGLRKYLSATGSGFVENMLACAFCFCILMVNILRFFDIRANIAFLAMASIAGWGYMLFFVMAFRLTGPFIVMISEMLCNDVLRFCIIYMVFLAGFSQAFFVLFNFNGFSGFLESVKQCFLGMLGDFDIDTYAQTTFQYVSVGLLIVYVVVVTILLLNLLIAMMGDTYGNVIEGATQIWHLERARIVYAIENEMSTEARNLETNKYWTNVEGERYLQVEEVDDEHFRPHKKKKHDDEKDDD
ncbi:unnamed protein product, partial [Didymodactylos carnosus]